MLKEIIIMSDKKLKRVDIIFSEDCVYKDVLADSLKQSNEDILKNILDSGLRGRGGAGFPTGLKWKYTSQEVAED